MSHWALQQLIAPAQEPVNLVEAKLQVRQDLSVDDAIITTFITAARMQVERDTQRQLVTSTYQLTRDSFPWYAGDGGHEVRQPYRPAWQWAEHLPVFLPKPPLQGIISLAYDDPSGTPQTMDPSTYQVDNQSEPGRVQPVYGMYWPITRAQLNAVRIQYVAGWPCTTVAAALNSTGSQTVTPASMTGIAVGQSLTVDTGTAMEVVTVTGVTSTTFTAVFAFTHAAGFVVSSVPQTLKQAILMLLTYWYKFRGDDGFANVQIIPPGYESLVKGWWTGDYC